MSKYYDNIFWNLLINAYELNCKMRTEQWIHTNVVYFKQRSIVTITAIKKTNFVMFENVWLFSFQTARFKNFSISFTVSNWVLTVQFPLYLFLGEALEKLVIFALALFQKLLEIVWWDLFFVADFLPLLVLFERFGFPSKVLSNWCFYRDFRLTVLSPRSHQVPAHWVHWDILPNHTRIHAIAGC